MAQDEVATQLKLKPFVIGAGWGRTGTLSLKTALETLGYGPCYHMSEMLGAPGHVNHMYDFVVEKIDAPVFEFMGYGPNGRWRSTTDHPTCLFYKELLALHPDALVILTVRDSAAWFASWRALYRTMEVARFAGYFWPLFHKWYAVARQHFYVPKAPFEDPAKTRSVYRELDVRSTPLNEDACIRAFERHNAEVEAYVPKAQLLVFRVSEGWGPLCSFLGCEVPTVPFPRLNEKKGLFRAAWTLGIHVLQMHFNFRTIDPDSVRDVLGEALGSKQGKQA